MLPDRMGLAPGTGRDPRGWVSTQRRSYRVALPLVVLGVLSGYLAVAPAGATTSARATPHISAARAELSALASQEVDPDDPAALSLATDAGIGLAEATERLEWQRRAVEVDLPSQMEAALGAQQFGGMWVDDEDRGHLKVGVVGPDSRADDLVSTLAQAQGLGAVVDVAPVLYSQARLDEVTDELGLTVAEVNVDARQPIDFGQPVGVNRIELRVPPMEVITPQQQEFVDSAQARYGEILQLGVAEGHYRAAACLGDYCDPPLRGGIGIIGPTSSDSPPTGSADCTGGFVAQSQIDSEMYMFTAGHCVFAHGISGRAWWTRFASNVPHKIGPVHGRARWGNGEGDMAIIRISNVPGWNPRSWVMVKSSPDWEDVPGTEWNHEYPITGSSTVINGKRVCHTGQTTGTSCGRVTALGVSRTYDIPYNGRTLTRTVNDLAQTTMCIRSGDSGAPVYDHNIAFGIVATSRVGNCRDSYYQGIRAAENELNVRVAYWLR